MPEAKGLNSRTKIVAVIVTLALSFMGAVVSVSRVVVHAEDTAQHINQESDIKPLERRLDQAEMNSTLNQRDIERIYNKLETIEALQLEILRSLPD